MMNDEVVLSSVTFQVDAPHMCAAVVVDGYTVVKAAPILGWSLYRPFIILQDWCRKKGYSITKVDTLNDPI